jgi:hypothetical protein
MSEQKWLKHVWLQLRAMNLENIPHWESGDTFARFALRHGLSPISPEREAKLEAMYAAYAARANDPEPVLATLYYFPVDHGAEVFDIEVERLKRQGGGLL